MSTDKEDKEITISYKIGAIDGETPVKYYYTEIKEKNSRWQCSSIDSSYVFDTTEAKKIKNKLEDVEP